MESQHTEAITRGQRSDRLPGEAVERGRATGVARREQQSPWSGGPFSLLRWLTNDIENVLQDFSVRRGLAPGNGRVRSVGGWGPDVDILQRGDELVVRVDLPGVSKDDVRVDVTDEAITIEGERREEREEQRDGVYWTERRCGSFWRTIPLPDGAIADTAKATFRNGILEIVMNAPSREASRGRQLEIGDGEQAQSRGQQEQTKPPSR